MIATRLDLDARSDGSATVDTDYQLTGATDLSNYEYEQAIDVGLRNSENRRHRTQLFRKLGARVRGSQVLYWLDEHLARECYYRDNRGRNRQPLCILAGYMSTDRGLHWNRRPKVDRK